MTGECPELRLRSGVLISNPLADALNFIRYDGTYQRYDAVEADPWDLSEDDLHLANRIIARMGAAPWAAVLTRRHEVRNALGQVPVSASLAEPADRVTWDALRRLYASLDHLPGVGLARATKILHKKRPALVPILDEVVVRYLRPGGGPTSCQGTWGARPSREPPRLWTGNPDRALPIAGGTPNVGLPRGAQALDLTRTYHFELQAVLPVLSCVRRALGRRGYDLTECRLLDIYLWAYSGTYEPLWRRRQGEEASAPRQREPSATSGPVDQEPDIAASGEAAREFWSDDDGFRAWLLTHPAGYVVNCERQPKSSYLKLHRASCYWLNLKNVRSWTNPYLKVCATTVSTLDGWARSRTSVTPDRCPTCKPSG